ncbi:MAG: radical SAM protein [Deltaproteobacteria bacterium]|nr:radical SAM protein [Deltaproteobacteria bacterium]
MEPELILINPWIYDFAAYDLWSKPLGLLYLAAYLSDAGFRVNLIDCLDIHHPGMKKHPGVSRALRRAFGTGKFWREAIQKPAPLKDFPRRYYRYGISKPLFVEALKEISRPAAILVTSLMTYWYPGVIDAIAIAREVHRGVPVVLGGIYAYLCRDHARRHTGADLVFDRPGFDSLESVIDILAEFGVKGTKTPPCIHRISYPAFDLLRKVDYGCILTSTGCPYNCSYCASNLLNPRFSQRDPDCVVSEIEYWHKKYGVLDFAFCDDALLINWDAHMGVILEKILRKNLSLRFHTPNAVHIREIRREVAEILYRSGFKTLRLGLETADRAFHDNLDRKLSQGDFERAVANLHGAGFAKNQIGAYILMGLPGQSAESVLDTIKGVGRSGVTPYLAEYSPIPMSPLWQKALECSKYDLANEPLFHNNILLPCWDEGQKALIPELRRMVRETRMEPS